MGYQSTGVKQPKTNAKYYWRGNDHVKLNEY